jgi:hypothetical protein
VPWQVFFHAEFEPEFNALDPEVQDELLAHASLLKEFGPPLKRPTADTLHGSKHDNMKELRFKAADGVWRIAFAFDPEQKPYCSSPEINQAAVRNGFTGNLLEWRMRGLTDTLHFSR